MIIAICCMSFVAIVGAGLFGVYTGKLDDVAAGLVCILPAMLGTFCVVLSLGAGPFVLVAAVAAAGGATVLALRLAQKALR